MGTLIDFPSRVTTTVAAPAGGDVMVKLRISLLDLSRWRIPKLVP